MFLNVVPKESFFVASDVVPISCNIPSIHTGDYIYERVYSNLRHLKKCNGTAS